MPDNHQHNNNHAVGERALRVRLIRICSVAKQVWFPYVLDTSDLTGFENEMIADLSEPETDYCRPVKTYQLGISLIIYSEIYGSRKTSIVRSKATWNESAYPQCNSIDLDTTCYCNCTYAYWHAPTILSEATVSYFRAVQVWLGYGVAEWTSWTDLNWNWSAQACLP